MRIEEIPPIHVDTGLLAEVFIGVLIGKALLAVLPERFFKKKVEIKRIDPFLLVVSFTAYFIFFATCLEIDQIPAGLRWPFPAMLDLSTLMFLNAVKGDRL